MHGRKLRRGETQGISLPGLMTTLSHFPIAINCNRKLKVIKRDDQSEGHVEVKPFPVITTYCLRSLSCLGNGS